MAARQPGGQAATKIGTQQVTRPAGHLAAGQPSACRSCAAVEVPRWRSSVSSWRSWTAATLSVPTSSRSSASPQSSHDAVTPRLASLRLASLRLALLSVPRHSVPGSVRSQLQAQCGQSMYHARAEATQDAASTCTRQDGCADKWPMPNETNKSASARML